MSKKIKVIISVFLLLFTVSTISALAEDPPLAEMTVTEVLSTNIAGGYGAGIAVAFDELLTLGYWEELDNSKIELVDHKGQPVPVVVESVGQQIAINRGQGYAYYGYVLTFKEGFTPMLKDTDTPLGPEIKVDQSFTFSGDPSSGGVWIAYVAPTGFSVDANEVELTVYQDTHQVVPEVLPVESNVVVVYESLDPAVATVSTSGLITPIEEGATTVKAYAGGFVEEIEVTVLPPAAQQVGIVVTNEDKEIAVALNHGFIELLEVYEVLDDDELGLKLDVTIDDISGVYDLTEEGTYNLTVTLGAYSDTFTLVVYIPKMVVTEILSTNIAGGWGEGIAVVFDVLLALDYWQELDNSKVEMIDPFGQAAAVKVESVGQQVSINRGQGYAYYGYILTIKEGFTPILKGTVDPLGPEIEADQSFIFKGDPQSGGYWEVYVAPTGLTIPDDEIELTIYEDTYQVVPEVLPAESNVAVVYESLDPAIASVSSEGLITPLTEGITTIKVYAGEFVEEIEVTVLPAALQVIGIKVTNPDKEVTVSTGRTFVQDLLVYEVLDGGATGLKLAVTIDDISGDYDLSVVGTYNLTVTIDGHSDTFILIVVSLPEAQVERFGTDSGWGAVYFQFDLVDIGQYINIVGPTLDNVRANISIAGSHDHIAGLKNLGGHRYELYLSSEYKPLAGDKLILFGGLTIFRYEGGTVDGNHDAHGGNFFGFAETKQEYVYVYTGTTWVEFEADPTGFEVSAPETAISVGSTTQLVYSVTPETTYGTPVFTSSDETVATVTPKGLVLGVSEGEVVITASLVGIDKTITITVGEAKDISGVELVDTYNLYYLPHNTPFGEFAPELTMYRLVYVDNSKSMEIELDGNYEILSFSTATVGNVVVTVKITHEGEEYTDTLTVEIYELYDQAVSEVGIVDWFIYGTFIQFTYTSTNSGNITNPAYLTELFENITYRRADGTEEEIKGIYQLQTNIALFPGFIYEDSQPILDETNYNEYYLEGDTITINAGTPVYKWTGLKDETDTMIPGTGEVIVEGYIVEEVIYRYNGNVWGIYIEHTDIVAADEEITVRINQNIAAGVSRVPASATTGVLSYQSADESIAEVTANGIIKGIKAGTTTIEVTITDAARPAFNKSITITVTVVDFIEGIVIEDVVNVTVNKDIDLSKVVAKYKWASGTIGEVVSLADATISGIDTSVLGEQNGVISVIVDGQTYTGAVTVNVTKANTAVIVLVTVGGVTAVGAAGAFFFLRKRKI